MRLAARALAAALLLVVLPSVSRAEPARVTELDAARVAVRTYPSVLAAREAAAAAEAEHTARARARLPDVTLSGRYTRLSSIPARFRTLSLPGPDGADASFVLPQILDGWASRAAVVVPLSDAWLGLAAAARAAGEDAAAQRIELEATRARVAFEARAAYLQFRRAFGARRIAETALEVATAQVRDQDERVRAGTAPPTSVLGLEAARYGAITRLTAADAELAASEAVLRAYLGPKAHGPALLPSEDEGATSAPFVAEAPAVRAAAASARASAARTDAETFALLPRLALVAGAEVVAPSPRAFAVSRLVGVPAWDVTLQLEWSISSLTVGTARRSRAAAEERALLLRVEEVRRQTAAQRASAAAAEQGARARVAVADAAVRSATKLAEARRAELAAGVATPLDVTSAEGERVRAELEKNDAALELRAARARLDLASGWSPQEER